MLGQRLAVVEEQRPGRGGRRSGGGTGEGACLACWPPTSCKCTAPRVHVMRQTTVAACVSWTVGEFLSRSKKASSWSDMVATRAPHASQRSNTLPRNMCMRGLPEVSPAVPCWRSRRGQGLGSTHVVCGSTPDTLSTSEGLSASALTRFASAARSELHW